MTNASEKKQQESVRASHVASPQDELPEHLREPPKEYWQWPMPTAWLLGVKLLGSLRDILLSSVAKIDIRNWMTAGDVVNLTNANAKIDGEDCCCIDFLADTGDSQQMVYQLAQLLLRPTLEVESWQKGEPKTDALPRGKLLVIGGDIAYPVASHRRLLERIRAPFKWAHDRLPEGDRDALAASPISLVAVPGNHDYYDGLRGFEALMHSPPVAIPPEAAPRADKRPPRFPPKDPGPPPPSEQPLRLPGYKLAQHASYFAIGLPFDWRLWGVDVEMTDIDDRQVAYFRGVESWEPPGPAPPLVAGDPSPPKRLILVTSRPAFVYQGQSDHAEVIGRSMTRLGLDPAFAEDGVLATDRIRLDLSGDVHLYERYWGTDHEVMPDDVDQVHSDRRAEARPAELVQYEPPQRYRRPPPAGSPADPTKMPKRGNDDKARAEPRDRANYASVVSGLGGAFHHPSQVRMGETAPHVSWPSQEHSAREIGTRLVNPYQIFRAGAVGIVGLVISLLCRRLLDGAPNVLDVPFRFGALPCEARQAIDELLLVAASVGIVLAMIGLPIGAYYLGRWSATPIRQMERPTGGISRFLKSLTHNRFSKKVLRFFGANPRSSWLFLTTAWLWFGTAVGWYGLAKALGAVANLIDEDAPVLVYVVATILIVGMAALGVFRAAQKNPNEQWGWNIVRRVVFLGFGVVVAVLVLWTPYIWIHLLRCKPLLGWMGVGVMVLTMVIRLGDYVFPPQLWRRRVFTLLGFGGLVAGAVFLPWLVSDITGPFMPPGGLEYFVYIGLFCLFGAYFVCLWVGWYFCICLQWNAHGNEAGGAARVTEYGEFLRIKLTKDRAEVWAISVEVPRVDKLPLHRRFLGRATFDFSKPPRARLIDHFELKPRSD